MKPQWSGCTKILNIPRRSITMEAHDEQDNAMFFLAYETEERDQRIKTEFMEKAANMLPLDQWMYSTELGEEMYEDYLHANDSAKNKRILRAYIKQNPHRFQSLTRYRHFAEDITKENVVGIVMCKPKILRDLLELGYDFTPQSEYQRQMVAETMENISIMSEYGQISAEFMCWAHGYDILLSMDFDNNRDRYERIIRNVTKFPEFQPVHLKALCDHVSNLGYNAATKHIADYIELTKATAYLAWQESTSKHDLQDDNAFRHIILRFID